MLLFRVVVLLFQNHLSLKNTFQTFLVFSVIIERKYTLHCSRIWELSTVKLNDSKLSKSFSKVLQIYKNFLVNLQKNSSDKLSNLPSLYIYLSDLRLSDFRYKLSDLPCQNLSQLLTWQVNIQHLPLIGRSTYTQQLWNDSGQPGYNCSLHTQ